MGKCPREGEDLKNEQEPTGGWVGAGALPGRGTSRHKAQQAQRTSSVGVAGEAGGPCGPREPQMPSFVQGVL